MGCSNVIEVDCQLITVSVVSHGQGELVAKLLEDLARCPSVSEIIVTQNIPECEIVCPASLLSRVRFVRNDKPLGFAANHNQAFRLCGNAMFAVVNPDIRFEGDPFPLLMEAIAESGAAMAAPAVRNPHGAVEDSIRRFPTLLGLVTKALRLSSGQIHLDAHSEPFCPDWVAGMFMLFRRETYALLGGFDEGFFLYYEDVDICVRAWRAGMKIVVCPSVSVVHDARRDSHRSVRHMRWHLASMARYFAKHYGRLPRVNRLAR
ncbi:MAG: glycosyltransferase family 2 protein [Azonexaceae bacterium]|nr:glycosyltransferase family 2 protein [Azonexaceae bacterium]